jgi:DNA-binding LytR/AlgR family response regulator
MISCLIVDDEQHAIDVLVHFVKQVQFLQLAGTCTNPLDALQMVNEQKIDLLFLDIQMPDISGIDFIKAANGKCHFILTTAYSEFATQGFELEVVDYLLKPIPFSRFLKAVQRVVNMTTRSNPVFDKYESIEDDYIFVKTEFKGKMLKINLRDIDYIEGMKNYVAIHHNGQKTMALLNLKDLEQRLPKKNFLRIHKSFIVAIAKITAVEGNKVMLRNSNTAILLGDAFKTEFMEIMKSKLME